jgi:predicted transcriptional regulator
MPRPSASFIMVVAALLLAAAPAAMLAAAEEGGVSATLSLDPGSSRPTVDVSSGTAAALVTGHVDVHKQAVTRETVKLSILGTPWDWQLTPDSQTVLLAQERFDFQGRVFVPAGTAEDDYPVTLEVSWLSIDGLVRLDTAQVTIRVVRIPFKLYVDVPTTSVEAGGTAAFVLTVVAGPSWGGAVALSVGELSAPGTPSPWLPYVYRFLTATRVELPQGGSETFTLELDVPANATEGSFGTVVRATSEDQPDLARWVSVSVQVQGAVAPVPPEPGWLEGLPGEPWMFVLALSLVLVVGVVGVLGGTEVGLYALLLLLLPMFTRLRHREVLNQFTRGEIFGFIKANPGASLTAVRENLGLSNGVAAYHLRVLLREEYVVARREGGYKRFYPRDMRVPRKRVHFTRLQIDVVEKVRMHPGVTQSSLARLLEESKQVVSYNLKVLVAAGVVRVERDGARMLCFPVEGASVLSEEALEVEGSEEGAPEGVPGVKVTAPVRWQ